MEQVLRYLKKEKGEEKETIMRCKNAKDYRIW